MNGDERNLLVYRELANNNAMDGVSSAANMISFAAYSFNAISLEHM
jgi:hypothetical protein